MGRAIRRRGGITKHRRRDPRGTSTERKVPPTNSSVHPHSARKISSAHVSPSPYFSFSSYFPFSLFRLMCRPGPPLHITLCSDHSRAYRVRSGERLCVFGGRPRCPSGLHLTLAPTPTRWPVPTFGRPDPPADVSVCWADPDRAPVRTPPESHFFSVSLSSPLEVLMGKAQGPQIIRFEDLNCSTASPPENEK